MKLPLGHGTGGGQFVKMNAVGLPVGAAHGFQSVGMSHDNDAARAICLYARDDG